jgi:hypothetical protein
MKNVKKIELNISLYRGLNVYLLSQFYEPVHNLFKSAKQQFSFVMPT